jgi:hypothetical protein
MHPPRRHEHEAQAEGHLGPIGIERHRVPQLGLGLLPLERLSVHVSERRVCLGEPIVRFLRPAPPVVSVKVMCDRFAKLYEVRDHLADRKETV